MLLNEKSKVKYFHFHSMYVLTSLVIFPDKCKYSPKSSGIQITRFIQRVETKITLLALFCLIANVVALFALHHFPLKHDFYLHKCAYLYVFITVNGSNGFQSPQTAFLRCFLFISVCVCVCVCCILGPCKSPRVFVNTTLRSAASSSGTHWAGGDITDVTHSGNPM